MYFDSIRPGLEDIMYRLKVEADNDTHPQKVDLGVGIYRNEQGVYHEMEVLRKAKQHFTSIGLDHDYEVTTGNSVYLRRAAEVAFGFKLGMTESQRLASVQTISGTGSIHIALMFLKHSIPGFSTGGVYVGTPAWGNYEPMIRLAGLQPRLYRHYDPITGFVDLPSVLNAVAGAPVGSTFILQTCCHNPTAADFNENQWRELAKALKTRRQIVILDAAYQGLGKGVEEDSFGVHACIEQGLDVFICQTFAKSFGLYGERVGALHVVCEDANSAAAVHDQLRCLIRWEFSSSPRYGARLVEHVLSDQRLKADWILELAAIRERLVGIRQRLYWLLVDHYKTPGNWDIITHGYGLFCLLPLNKAQCETLIKAHHIYLVPNGRITLSGLAKNNIEYVAKCVDAVVRSGGRSQKLGTAQL